MLARLFHFLISLLLLPLACLILWLLQVWPRLVQSLSADAEPEDEDDEEIYLPIVKLRLRPTCTKFCREHCPSVTIRALVDTGSGVSYVSGRVVERLQLKASPVRLNNRYYWRQCRFEDNSKTEGLALTTAVRVVLEALEDEQPSAEVVTVYVYPDERIPLRQKPPSARICRQLLEKKTIQLIDDPELDLVESFPEDAEAIDLVIGQDLYCRKVLEERQSAVPLSFNQVVLRTQFGHVLQGGGRVVQALLQEMSDVSLLQILLLPLVRYIIRGIFQARTYFWCEVRQLRSLICGFIWQRRFAAIPETPQVVGHTPQPDQHIPPIKTINLPTLVLTVGNAQHRNSFSKCIRVLLDSGAKYSTITPKTVRSLELPLELVMPPKVLYDFTGTPYHLYTSVVLCLVSPLDSEDGQLVRLYVDPIEDRVPADGPRSLLLDEAIFRHIELTDGTPEEGDIIEAIIGQDLLTSAFLMEPEQVAILSATEETAAPTCWAFIPTMYGNVAVGVGYETGTSAIIGNEGQSRR